LKIGYVNSFQISKNLWFRFDSKWEVMSASFGFNFFYFFKATDSLFNF